MSIDQLSPQAETWSRDTWTQPQRIEDTPSWWRQVAEIEDRAGNADIGVQYRRMADLLDAAILRVAGMPS